MKIQLSDFSQKGYYGRLLGSPLMGAIYGRLVGKPVLNSAAAWLITSIACNAIASLTSHLTDQEDKINFITPFVASLCSLISTVMLY